MSVASEKIFIIGLPRTGTTSICAALLDLGYTVAHTAYTPLCMEKAQAIADTPIFCDYQTLYQQYPNAKFIQLRRELTLWLPSIRQLLERMFLNVTRTDGGFNPILKRCYQKVFTPLTLENIASDQFLISCYERHQSSIDEFFSEKPEQLLSIDVSKTSSYQKLVNFLALDKPIKSFEKINVGGKITAWNKIKHPLKIDANLKHAK